MTAKSQLSSNDIKVSQLAGNTGGSEGWVAKSITELADGDVIVVVSTHATNGSFAMSNDNGSSAAPAAVAVTVADGKLSAEPADNIKWVFKKDGANYSFQVSGTENFLYCTNNNNGLRVGSGSDKVFVIDSNYLKNSGQGRFVGVYNKADWRSYTSINNNIKDQTFTFFVKK